MLGNLTECIRGLRKNRACLIIAVAAIGGEWGSKADNTCFNQWIMDLENLEKLKELVKLIARKAGAVECQECYGIGENRDISVQSYGLRELLCGAHTTAGAVALGNGREGIRLPDGATTKAWSTAGLGSTSPT